MSKKSLSHSSLIEVKFSEADPLGIVWHGHHIRYFEDGREAFGKTYGLRYLDFYRNDIVVPIIKIDCNYHHIIRYSHLLRLETTYIDCAAAKLLFEYQMYNDETNEKVASGSSTQVFLDKTKMELMLTIPPYMSKWKKDWLKDE